MNDVASRLLLSPADAELRRPESLDKLRAAIDGLGPLQHYGDVISIAADGTVAGISATSYNSASAGNNRGASDLMYRAIDPGRVKRYIELLQNHLTAVREHPMGTRIANSRTRLQTRLVELDKNWQKNERGGNVDQGLPVDAGVREQRRKALMDAKVEALTEFERRARAAVKSYVRYQLRFIGQKHRAAIAYMAYWTALKATIRDPALQKQIDEYNELRKTLQKLIPEQIHNQVRQSVLDAYKTVAENGGGVTLDEARAMKIDELYGKHQQMLLDETQRLQVVYLKGSPSVMDELLDPKVITLYALKAVRVCSAWVALRIAGNVFQRMYDKRVYGVVGGMPPSPLVFVGLAIAVELSITLSVAVLLMIVGRVIQGVDGMPLDAELMSSWAVDVAASTVMTTLILCVIAITIKRKKYFRYKYEGDRGVRAMQAIGMYTYCVSVLLPFYRLTYG